MALSFGSQADLIAMVFNLRFMPQGHLDLEEFGRMRIPYKYFYLKINMKMKVQHYFSLNIKEIVHKAHKCLKPHESE